MATQKPVGIDQRAAQANSAYGNSVVHYDKLSVTSLATSDILRLVRVPAGTRVDEVIIINDDLDSSTAAVTCRVGYTPVNSADGPTADDDYFFPASSTIFHSAARNNSASPPKVFDYDVYVDVTITVVPGSMKAGDIHCIVRGEIIGTK